MNAYTIHFKYAREHVEATDSDMAVMAAAKIIAQDLTDEERGELIAVELHGKNGMSDFFYAGSEIPSTEIDEIITREEARPAAKPEPKCPARRARGMILTREFCTMERRWNFTVERLGYSASLHCALHEEELHGGRSGCEFQALSPADVKVIENWVAHEDALIAKAEKETGLIERQA